MIFLSELLRATVVDVRQHTVGTVRDLVARMGEPYPRVTALVVSHRGHEARRRARRSLVDVGCPQVEGNRRDLEPEPDQEQRHPR